MNTINEEDRKKIDNYASKYKDYPNPKNALMRGVLLGAEFSYHLRDPEVERLRNDLDDALDLKAGNGPTALSRVVQERDALKKQVEEMKEWPSKKVSVSDGIYWLIEERGALCWLMSDGHTWTTDANKAAKYPSQYEATLERERRGLTLLHYTVTEHQWVPLT